MRIRERRTVLILGGTAEAAALARALVERFGEGLRVVTSLAGRTATPAKLPGEVRTGGFGGADGLAAALRDRAVDLLIDATHPFAVRIARHARTAAEAAGVPRLVLIRPDWLQQPGDRWIVAEDAAAAARLVPGLGARVFLAIGARELDAFADVEGASFVVRLIEPPSHPPPLPRAEIVIARPPFTLDAERRLLQRYAIALVISKASGGAVPAKLVAAREAGLPVILLRRPAPEPGPSAASVAEALDWIAARLGA